MTRLLAAALAAAFASMPAITASAQLRNAQARVRVGHYHLNVTSLGDHLRFWVDTLGGTPTRVGSVDAVRFGDVFLLLRQQPPTGPTRGTTFDHIGFAVPNVPEFTAKVVSRGYQLTVGREIPGQAPPASGQSAVYGRFSYLLGPDGVKIELVTSSEASAPPSPGSPPRLRDGAEVVHHHVHFTNPQYVEMGQWYIRALDATVRPGQTDFFFGADLPGIGYMLNFFKWEMNEPLVGTAGRAVDHVGFEVRNLEEFCRRLEAKGIRLTTPYRTDPDLNIGTATMVDPWGTVVELTEGLDKLL